MVALLEIAVLFCYEERIMIEGYMTINEVAEKWSISPRGVRAMCLEGKIPQAAKLGRIWVIPSEVERPLDGRITTGEYVNWRK